MPEECNLFRFAVCLFELKLTKILWLSIKNNKRIFFERRKMKIVTPFIRVQVSHVLAQMIVEQSRKEGAMSREGIEISDHIHADGVHDVLQMLLANSSA